VNGTRVLQIEQPFRSDTVKVTPRKNRQVVLEFSVQKEYENLEQAAAAAVTEESQIPFKGILFIEEDCLRQMVSALESVSIQQVGVTLKIRYRFVGEGFTTEGGAISVPPVLVGGY
jgi:hypothetical protein